jgi:hypothetical protein
MKPTTLDSFVVAFKLPCSWKLEPTRHKFGLCVQNKILENNNQNQGIEKQVEKDMICNEHLNNSKISSFNINLYCKHTTICHPSITRLLNGKEMTPRCKTFVQACAPQNPYDL